MLSFTLARRFRRSKKQSGFTSFIALSSTFGIGLGCAVLIIMLSVMNGFERELQQRLLSIVPHGELLAVDSGGLRDWREITEVFQREPHVKQVQPFAKATGLLQKGKLSKAAELTAVDPGFAENSAWVGLLPEEVWRRFQAQPDGVVLGDQIVSEIGLKVGDKFQVLLPEPNSQGQLAKPKAIWLTFSGSVNLGGELDNFVGFMHLDKAAQALAVTTGAQGIQISYHDPFAAAGYTRELGYRLQQYAYMSDWTRTQGHLYQDIQLVRLIVYIALTLVIAVACFNVISSLVMVVNERKPEIAMLKTMGADSRIIVGTFVWQGLINALIGIVVGSILGVLVAQNLTEIASFAEAITGTKLLSGDIYFIDFLPTQLLWRDVMVTISIAMVLSLLATVYPALKANKVEPAKILGH